MILYGFRLFLLKLHSLIENNFEVAGVFTMMRLHLRFICSKISSDKPMHIIGVILKLLNCPLITSVDV